MQFQCPTCSEPMRCPDEYAGRKIKCPKCQQKIEVPAVNKTALGKLEEEPTTQVSVVKKPALANKLDEARTHAMGQLSPLDGTDLLRNAGALVMLAGIGLGVYYFNLDTSIEIGNNPFGHSGRVQNLGLMNERSNGIMIGAAVSIFGLIMLVGGHISRILLANAGANKSAPVQ